MLTTDPFQVYKQDAKYSCDPFVMVLANYPAQLRWRHGFSMTLGIVPGDRGKAVHEAKASKIVEVRFEHATASQHIISGLLQVLIAPS
jgi:hypothetical protein